MYVFGIVCSYLVNTKFVEIHTQSWRVLKFLLQVGFLLYFLISRSLPTTAGVKLQHQKQYKARGEIEFLWKKVYLLKKLLLQQQCQEKIPLSPIYYSFWKGTLGGANQVTTLGPFLRTMRFQAWWWQYYVVLESQCPFVRPHSARPTDRKTYCTKKILT